MVEQLTPGVMIEEIRSGPPPIEGVATHLAAFIGATERGALTPRLVTGLAEFARFFGADLAGNQFLPDAVQGFFENGGRQLLVCRVVGEGATTAQVDLGDFILRATGPGGWGSRVWVALRPDPTGFRIRAAYFADGQEIYDPDDPANDTKLPRPQFQEELDDLVADEHSNDYFERRLARTTPAALITLMRKPGAVPGASPAAYNGRLMDPGDSGNPQGVGAEPQGLAALEADEYREVSLVYAPDADLATQRALINHCERLRFRFAVLDAPRGVSDPTTLDPRLSIADSSFAAFYYPWLWVADSTNSSKRLVPPGGRVLGVYARTDTERGVARAPANEVLRGVLDVEFPINDHLQDNINPFAVNAIRVFPGRGIRVWGARTLTSNAEWKYVNIRRLFIFLEHSIQAGLQWVVFEPNDERLWARVSDTIRLFLRGVWRDGALPGSREDEAFFIACGPTTMTQADIQEGRLICEIGVAPMRPAEFVHFRFVARTACGP